MASINNKLNNNKLKFPKNFFKFRGNIKAYLTSKRAVGVYLHLSAIIAVSVFAAAMAGRYVSSRLFSYGLANRNPSRIKSAPAGSKKTGIELYVPILTYNILGSTINGNLVSYSGTGNAAFESLNLSLIGTIKGGINYAFFTDKSAEGKEIFVKQGDIIKSGYTLSEVHSKYVIVTNGSSKNMIMLAKENTSQAAGQNQAAVPSAQPLTENGGPGGGNFAKAVKQTGAYSYEINRSMISKKQLNAVFTQMHAVPNIVSGKINGFKVLNVMPTGIFHYMGFDPGDVIQNINGTPLTNPQEAVNLLSGLLYQKNITVNISRGESNITLKFLINS